MDLYCLNLSSTDLSFRIFFMVFFFFYLLEGYLKFTFEYFGCILKF